MSAASTLRVARTGAGSGHRRVHFAAMLLLAVVGALLWPGHARQGLEGTLAVPGAPLVDACRAAGVAHPPPEPRVVIRKAARTLALYSGSRLVKEYRVGLGGWPEGDKERQGDRRTPTGDLYVCTRLRQSRFHRFLGLSYPGPEDAARGLKGGLITRREYRAILSAHRWRRQPPWETRLGGAIGIHGGGAEADWTLGCIAVEHGEIEELFAALPLGTPVRILP